jgi:hypothetical protein
MKQSFSWPFHRHLFGIRSQASAYVLKALPSKILTKTVQNATLLIQKKKEKEKLLQLQQRLQHRKRFCNFRTAPLFPWKICTSDFTLYDFIDTKKLHFADFSLF